MVFEEETVLVMDSSMPEDLSFVVKAQRLRMISQGAIAMKGYGKVLLSRLFEQTEDAEAGQTAK